MSVRPRIYKAELHGDAEHRQATVWLDDGYNHPPLSLTGPYGTDAEAVEDLLEMVRDHGGEPQHVVGMEHAIKRDLGHVLQGGSSPETEGLPSQGDVVVANLLRTLLAEVRTVRSALIGDTVKGVERRTRLGREIGKAIADEAKRAIPTRPPPSNAEVTTRLLGDTDGQVWAQTFMEIADGYGWDENDILDEDLLTGWFANAIEVGRTAGEAVPSQVPSEVYGAACRLVEATRGQAFGPLAHEARGALVAALEGAGWENV